jgi:hypothetical protein
VSISPITRSDTSVTISIENIRSVPGFNGRITVAAFDRSNSEYDPNKDQVLYVSDTFTQRKAVIEGTRSVTFGGLARGTPFQFYAASEFSPDVIRLTDPVRTLNVRVVGNDVFLDNFDTGASVTVAAFQGVMTPNVDDFAAATVKQKLTIQTQAAQTLTLDGGVPGTQYKLYVLIENATIIGPFDYSYQISALAMRKIREQISVTAPPAPEPAPPAPPAPEPPAPPAPEPPAPPAPEPPAKEKIDKRFQPPPGMDRYVFEVTSLSSMGVSNGPGFAFNLQMDAGGSGPVGVAVSDLKFVESYIPSLDSYADPNNSRLFKDDSFSGGSFRPLGSIYVYDVAAGAPFTGMRFYNGRPSYRGGLRVRRNGAVVYEDSFFTTDGNPKAQTTTISWA